MKECAICFIPKKFSEFYQSKRHKGGVQNFCKMCAKIRNNKYYKENQAKLSAKYHKTKTGVTLIVKTYEYRKKMLTIKKILKLKKCNCSLSHLSKMLKLGKTVQGIIEVKKCSDCKEEKAFLQFNKNKSKHDGMAGECKACVSHLRKGTNIAKAPSIETTKANKIFKAARTIAEEKRQIAIKIMSVPVNPKKTQEYYMMLNFTPRSMSNLGAVEQVSKASETAEREKYRA